MSISLTSYEQERIAYINGNGLLAAYCASCDDLEAEVDAFDDRLEAEYSRGYKDGELEATGKDIDALLAAQRQEIARLKTEHQSLRTYLTDLQVSLTGDPCKTGPGRKAIATHIRTKLLATPRY